MKRIILLSILAAAQLACLAQTNPKIESLYAYLKAKGIVKEYFLSNKNSEGLRKQFTAVFSLHDESSAPILANNGQPVNARLDSAYRAEWRNQREAFNVIRRTLSELVEDAQESYSYEYHKNGHDTIITAIALKSFDNDEMMSRLHRRYPDMTNFGITFSDGKMAIQAPEIVYLIYKDTQTAHKVSKRQDAIGYGDLYVNTIVDTTLYATKDCDVDAFLKAIAPVLKDKSIKRHAIHCQHDSTFDGWAYHKTASFGKGFITFAKSARKRGDNRLTVYKFTSEDKAKAVLHQLMECARQYVADHPREAYTICSEEYFPPLNRTPMFKGGNYKNTYEKDQLRRSVSIHTLMDKEGFYIFINDWEDDESVPGEWKKLKSMVNGKKVYYSDEL